MIRQAVDRLTRLFDTLSVTVRGRLEGWVVLTAAVGFLIHLVLILLVRTIPGLQVGVLANLDRNFLHAIYTPFTFILFFEVLLLVVALPTSHTSSVAKQYQIISLIVVRRVFKDIGALPDLESWVTQMEAASAVLFDMCGAVLMFLLVTLFTKLRTCVTKTPVHRSLADFIRLKKVIALLLCVMLVVLAAYNLFTWMTSVFQARSAAEPGHNDLDRFFFPDFFEFMIFTDVFLLIVSIAYYERYEFVFRNAGFVISTVLLRFSLASPKPYDVLLGIVAMAYGLIVLAIFAFFTRGRQSEIHTSAADAE